MTAVPSSLFGRAVARVHCVGAGGMGVGPLAILLAGLGYAVSGEDDAMTDAMRDQLERAGVTMGPLPADAQLVACSTAIPPRHPAAEAAKRLGIPVVRRGELLAEVVRGRRLVAVCGAHGKTTTTAMLAFALRQAGFDAGYVVGGLFGDDALAPAAAGSGDWIVAEIDESDGTIDGFSPELTVVTNLDWDHPDYYRRKEDLERTFAALFARTRGTVLSACGSEDLERLTRGLPNVLRFGVSGDFSHRVLGEDAEGMTLALGGRFGELAARVRARGAFNAANACAALAAARLMGCQISADLLAGYPSVRRRQGLLHDSPDLRVIEDYAHHPTEIAALLESLRAQLPAGARLVVAFQPHRYSRTVRFLGEFADALARADSVHLLDVYPAGEAPMDGGSSRDLAAAFRQESRPPVANHGGDSEACWRAIEAELQPGDWVAVVGAGDIDQMARAWLSRRSWDAWAAQLRPDLSGDTVLRREEPLGPKTTLRSGGAARLYAEPASEEDLRRLVVSARRNGTPFFVLGRGSNLVVPDEGVEGLVVSLAHPCWSKAEVLPDGRVLAGAGLRLKALCGLATKAGLAGFEFLEGIPASVGGALRMNAGAMGGWIFDVVEELRLMLPDGSVRTLSRSELSVDYRHCAQLETAVALSAVLRPASHAESMAINERIEVFRAKRHATQPREPSAGCIFRNPPGDSAGRLIDACGLKGLRVGDAMVSPVHANFIVNLGSARSSDVVALVRLVRACVLEKSGILLEPEVLLFGKEWRRVL